MTDQSKDFYQHLRQRIRDWAQTKAGQQSKWVEYLLFAPDMFHLLCKLSLDAQVPVQEKTKLVAVIAYFISPLDLLPEALVGPFGFLDDLALSAYVLNSLINQTSVELIRKHWAGDADVLEVIQKILQAADQMIGSGLWNKIKKRFMI
ncbi:DUF1232 domain-containing protein [candidate division KSB1 bacterium]|nr:DUF1232 domain-containing protein [candidate division KSB1 bacterium]